MFDSSPMSSNGRRRSLVSTISLLIFFLFFTTGYGDGQASSEARGLLISQHMELVTIDDNIDKEDDSDASSSSSVITPYRYTFTLGAMGHIPCRPTQPNVIVTLQRTTQLTFDIAQPVCSFPHWWLLFKKNPLGTSMLNVTLVHTLVRMRCVFTMQYFFTYNFNRKGEGGICCLQ